MALSDIVTPLTVPPDEILNHAHSARRTPSNKISLVNISSDAIFTAL